MQIESILIFVVLVALSSLLNKKKENKRQENKRRTPEVTQSQQQETQRKPPRSQPAAKGKRTLQDLFKEMQAELETAAKPHQPQEDEPKQSGEAISRVEADESQRRKEALQRKREAQKRRSVPDPEKERDAQSVLYRNEIRDRKPQTRLDFGPQSVVNGILYAEILGKPKSRR